MRLTLLIAIVVLLLPASRAPAEEPPWNGAKQAFKKALKSKDPKERARAFEYLRRRSEVDAVVELVSGFRSVEEDLIKVEKNQTKQEKSYESTFNKLEKAKRAFQDSQHSPKDISRFNKAERKLSKELDLARHAAKKLENDWSRTRALLDSGTDVAASILRSMDPTTVVDALSVLRQDWLQSKDAFGGPVRWMEALGPVRRDAVTQELLSALADAELQMPARVAAFQALAERRDGTAMTRAIDMLDLPMDQFPLLAASIAALQTMHDRRGIVPLINFLSRDQKEVGRLKNDAREALVSLTGQAHGPYYDPWWTWWKENKKSYKMPDDPCPSPSVVPQDDGSSFYGIHTFSNRVLYIVDISASMDWALKGKRGEPGGEKAKMVTARRELIGAIQNLDDGANYNVILFNHEVIPWSGRGVVIADSTSRKKAERWINDMQPTGLTNIHDALQAGFRLIHRVTGRPDFDTIFFLTDGKPTAGKIKNAAKILEAVREWNEVSNTQIHVIGIGGDADLDEDFLQSLAKIGKGKYVRHGG